MHFKGTQRIFPQVSVVNEATSTNELLRLKFPHVCNGDVIVTQNQTQGKGRLGRTWHLSPGDGLAISYAFVSKSCSPERFGWIALLTGYAVRQTITDVLGASAGDVNAHGFETHDGAIGIKWPNDVLVGSRKISGILCQMMPKQDRQDVIIIGTGMNLKITPEHVLYARAISLVQLCGQEVSADEVLTRYLTHMKELFGWFEAEAGDISRSVIANKIRQCCLTLGKDIVVLLPDGAQHSGVAVDIDDQARLVVKTQNGTQAFVAGDVLHVR